MIWLSGHHDGAIAAKIMYDLVISQEFDLTISNLKAHLMQQHTEHSKLPERDISDLGSNLADFLHYKLELKTYSIVHQLAK